MDTKIRVVVTVLALSALGLTALCQASTENAGRAPERNAAAVISEVLDAWDHADARAIAALYEPDGDFVSPEGDHAVGHRAIEIFYERAFERGYAGTRASAAVIHARSLSAKIVLIDGSWTIDPTPGSKIKVPEAGLFVAALRQHDGRWWITALREQADAKGFRELEVK